MICMYIDIHTIICYDMYVYRHSHHCVLQCTYMNPSVLTPENPVDTSNTDVTDTYKASNKAIKNSHNASKK